MLAIVLVMARRVNVLRKINPVFLQRMPNTLEQVERLSLVVDCVERGCQVESVGLGVAVEVAQIAHLELQVVEPALRGPVVRPVDRRVRQVVADEPVESIAQQVGYEDSAFFGRLFRRKVGVTPAQYRKRFRGLRRALESGEAW